MAKRIIDGLEDYLYGYIDSWSLSNTLSEMENLDIVAGSKPFSISAME